MGILADMLSFSFICRALVVGIFVALCAALLGVSMVLKRYAMIGDGLSHVSFGALSVALAFGFAPLKLAIPAVALVAFFLLRITESGKVKSDAAIAAVSASSLAIGIIVTSLKTGINTDVCSYMFGSILAMTQEDVLLSVILSAAVLILFVFCYHKIFAITFDENFAKATGIKVGAYNFLIAVTIAVIIVLAMNLVGSLLISALIIFPALSAMRLFKSFKSVIIFSAAFSVVCTVVGLLASILVGTPVGSTIVASDIAGFIICLALSSVKRGVRV